VKEPAKAGSEKPINAATGTVKEKASRIAFFKKSIKKYLHNRIDAIMRRIRIEISVG
jgi:hypothetical protein